MIDWITQTLTTSPLWIQALVVFAVVLPLCAGLGALLIRVLDLVAELLTRFFENRRGRGIGEVGSGS
ncbi:hypothetical protein [Corynebacterium sp. A21]|uniref:hypothetical protein n=1 Tax=Corynebacterium sp. A21 TaxID=3457318 RepID=UPI003FCFD80C